MGIPHFQIHQNHEIAGEYFCCWNEDLFSEPGCEPTYDFLVSLTFNTLHGISLGYN